LDEAIEFRTCHKLYLLGILKVNIYKLDSVIIRNDFEVLENFNSLMNILQASIQDEWENVEGIA